MTANRIHARAGRRNWALSAALSGLLLFVAACAVAPASDGAPPFTLPVLTMAEMHRLVSETIAAQDDEKAQPLAIARILCGAKGYHPDGAKFADCRALLVKATTAKPEILAQARALARIAETLAAVRSPVKPKPRGVVSRAGRPPPCYDLSTARLIVCEDI
ncbi:MAG: hypothetical protein QF449_09275 [Alphaproteobacteria bacterium]|jgi:hypothetical protein|nr:hypothetical protein [Alphaproteobacteria bacterium]MDP6589273.1 hypothetical protein [Alphaproteobacteria bacterium]MDP6818218.1 hypothetical protein [Alphaproteobacteria bacterium]|tara:strand:+ start:688 stop:1170 length:483 start_codon:yes stop_codon:yes gene_type:complete